MADTAAPKNENAASVNVAKVAEAVEADKPVAKIDAAVAAEKAAPAKKAPAKAKAAAKRKPVARKAAAAKAPVKRKAAVRKAALVAKPSKAAAKSVSKTKTASTKPSISELKDKIMATAKKTTTTDFTATVKETAAEAQTRAKAAYDKLQGYAGDMTEFTKGNVEALVESGKILGAGLQDMARSEVEAAKGAYETATADMKAFAAIKSPTELFKLQGEMARRNFDALVAHYSKNAETSMKLANDAFAPISSRMSLAAEKLSKAA